MKNSTLAVAALLTTLATATVIPAAYADDTQPQTPSTSCSGCKGCAGADGSVNTGSDS